MQKCIIAAVAWSVNTILILTHGSTIEFKWLKSNRFVYCIFHSLSESQIS